MDLLDKPLGHCCCFFPPERCCIHRTCRPGSRVSTFPCWLSLKEAGGGGTANHSLLFFTKRPAAQFAAGVWSAPSYSLRGQSLMLLVAKIAGLCSRLQKEIKEPQIDDSKRKVFLYLQWYMELKMKFWLQLKGAGEQVEAISKQRRTQPSNPSKPWGLIWPHGNKHEIISWLWRLPPSFQLESSKNNL